MARKRAYLAYPFIMFGTREVFVFKEKLKHEGFEVIDPYEKVGVGSNPIIAFRDLRLIDSADLFVAYLPCQGTQTGMEIMYAFLKGKKVRIYTRLEGPFFEWLKGKGVEVYPI